MILICREEKQQHETTCTKKDTKRDGVRKRGGMSVVSIHSLYHPRVYTLEQEDERERVVGFKIKYKKNKKQGDFIDAQIPAAITADE